MLPFTYKQPQHSKKVLSRIYKLYSMYGSGIQILLQPPASLFLVDSVWFIPKPIVQPFVKRVKRNPRRSMRKIASQLGISRSSMYRIYKNDLRMTAYKNNSHSYYQPLSSRNDMTEAKRCWQRWSTPSAMSSSGPMGRSSKRRHLPTHRMIECIHLLIYAVWNQLMWWCKPQSPLMDLSPLWFSLRRVSRWTSEFTTKCCQKMCYPGSLKV